MSKRILIDARYLDGTFSGIGTYSRHLIENLSRVDQENQYFVVVRPDFRENLSLGNNFEVLSYRPKPISVQSYFRFQEYVRDLSPDLVHSLAPHAPILWDGPVVVTVHDLQPFVDPDFSARRSKIIQGGYNIFYKWAYPTVFAKAKWIICDSHATRDDVARIMPRVVPKLIVIHPGLAPPGCDPPTQGQIDAIRAKCQIKGRYFLYYGSTRPNKNLPRLIKAFGRLIRTGDEAYQDLQLVLVLKRDRFFRDITRAINSAKVRDHVLVLDPLVREEKQALLAGALAFTFPTKYEGFGFPPLEAMQARVAVLAGDSGSLPEVVEDAALLVNTDSIDEISEGLRRLATDEDLRKRLIALGDEQWPRFEWPECARLVRDVYRLLF